MTPEQIARDFDCDVNAVKCILMSRCPEYRDANKAGKENAVALGDMTDEDEQLANQVFRELAQSAENEGVRLKAAMRIKDEKRKRLDVRKDLGRTVNNVLVLNEHFAKAAQALASKVLPANQQQKTIEV